MVLGCDDGKICALGADGAVHWTYDILYRVESIYPVDVNGQVQLLVGSESKLLHSLTAEGGLAWTRKVAGWIRDICVAYIDHDGQAEVILSIFSLGHSIQTSRSILQVWKILDGGKWRQLTDLCKEKLYRRVGS